LFLIIFSTKEGSTIVSINGTKETILESSTFSQKFWPIKGTSLEISSRVVPSYRRSFSFLFRNGQLDMKPLKNSGMMVVSKMNTNQQNYLPS
jgi:hypothetical protein